MFSMLCVKLTYFYMWATHQSFRVWKLNLKRKYFSQTGHATDASKKLLHATLKCHQVILEFVCISFKDNCLFVSCRLLQYYLCYPSVSINLNFTRGCVFVIGYVLNHQSMSLLHFSLRFVCHPYRSVFGRESLVWRLVSVHFLKIKNLRYSKTHSHMLHSLFSWVRLI